MIEGIFAVLYASHMGLAQCSFFTFITRKHQCDIVVDNVRVH